MKPIFVFGSNRQGRHGKGAAAVAYHKYGAIYGKAEGFWGNSYAIITKELRRELPKVSVEDYWDGIKRFVEFARSRPDLSFDMTPVGTGLAGFTREQLERGIALAGGLPSNVNKLW